jgi:EAL domain-containing protein (putative c-di-GMP-specific phosphodiesterase class I)
VPQGVTDAIPASPVPRLTPTAGRREGLARLIAEGRVRSVFHPIVRLCDGEVHGHEALMRPLGGVPFDSVEDLFAFAESTDLLIDLETLCREQSIRSAARLDGAGLLFLNASTRAVEDPRWSSDALDVLLAQSGFRPRHVVVEITERVAIGRRDLFRKALETFKEHGYRVAVDDVGSGHASLQALAAIEPDFLKCDMSLVRGVDTDRSRQGLLESLRALAGRMGACMIAEGVEREEEREALVNIGIELGQGYLFHGREARS